MRIVSSVIIIFIAAYAVEYELQWDNSSVTAGYAGASGNDGRLVVDFTSPSLCHLSKVKAKPYPYTGYYNTTIYVYDDLNGYPNNLLGQKDFLGNSCTTWITFDISSLNIILNANQIFYTGPRWCSIPNWINQWGYETVPPNHYYYARVESAPSWSIYSNRDLFVRAIIDDDMTPPYVNGQVPAPQSNFNPPLISLVFHCRDDDKGVDPDTIVFTCTGNGNPIPGSLDKDISDLHDVICTFTPTNPVGAGVCVLCNVHSGLADGLGNATTSDITWWFTVGGNKVRTNSLGELKAIFHQ